MSLFLALSSSSYCPSGSLMDGRSHVHWIAMGKLADSNDSRIAFHLSEVSRSGNTFPLPSPSPTILGAFMIVGVDGGVGRGVFHA